MRELGAINNCEIANISHNLTNKFQQLNISVSKAARAYVSEKYNTWMANEISEQLEKGLVPPDIKVSLLLLVRIPLHAKWI